MNLSPGRSLPPIPPQRPPLPALLPRMRVPAQLLPGVRWEGEGTVAHPLPASALGIWPGGCGWQRKTASCSLGSVHLHRVLSLGISRLSRPELPIDRVETDSVLVPKEQSADPHRAWGMARADGAAQSITCVCVWASRLNRLSCDLSAPWRSPWIVDSLLTVSVVCLSTTLFMDIGVGISYHFHMP